MERYNRKASSASPTLPLLGDAVDFLKKKSKTGTNDL